jgi:hypothetical protein
MTIKRLLESGHFRVNPLYSLIFYALTTIFPAAQDRLSATPDRSPRESGDPCAGFFMPIANRRTVVGVVLDRKLGSFCKINKYWISGLGIVPIRTARKHPFTTFSVRRQGNA